jgi:hypothetical protein
VDVASLDVELDLGLGDAAAALELAAQEDPNTDPEVARERLWQRVAAQAEELERRVRPALRFWQGAASCPLSPAPAQLRRAEETGFARLRFSAHCPQPVRVLGLEWTLPFRNDPVHRALVRVSGAGVVQSAILSAARRRVDLELR